MKFARIAVAILALSVATVAVADSIRCVIHTYAPCYYTGESNMGAKKYHCTCGDDMWMRTR